MTLPFQGRHGRDPPMFPNAEFPFGRSAFSLPRCPEKFETVQKMLYTFRENCVILLVFGAGGQTRPSAGGGQIPHKQERKCRRFSEDKAIQG